MQRYDFSLKQALFIPKKNTKVVIFLPVRALIS